MDKSIAHSTRYICGFSFTGSRRTLQFCTIKWLLVNEASASASASASWPAPYVEAIPPFSPPPLPRLKFHNQSFNIQVDPIRPTSEQAIKMFLLQAIGLQRSTLPPPNYVAGFLVTNFLFAHMASNTRWPKKYYGLDHNDCPRQDLDKYGDAMVKEGKLSRKALDALKRQEAAHSNNIDNFPFFVGTMLFALYSGVPNVVINQVGALYTVIRIAYTVAYTVTGTEEGSWVRSGLWLAGNGLCIWTLMRTRTIEFSHA